MDNYQYHFTIPCHTNYPIVIFIFSTEYYSPRLMQHFAFLGTKMHPDAALILENEFSVAIELHHEPKGVK